MTKLNLGCGPPRTHMPGWVNCDVREEAKFDHYVNVEYPLPWENDSVEEVFCGNLFDSLTREVFNNLMREIWRVLEPGGYLGFEQMDVTKNFDAGIGWPYFVTPVTRYLFYYYEVGNSAYETWKEIYKLPGFTDHEINHNQNGVMVGKIRKPF